MNNFLSDVCPLGSAVGHHLPFQSREISRLDHLPTFAMAPPAAGLHGSMQLIKFLRDRT
jgi:hypothetical protein